MSRAERLAAARYELATRRAGLSRCDRLAAALEHVLCVLETETSTEPRIVPNPCLLHDFETSVGHSDECWGLSCVKCRTDCPVYLEWEKAGCPQ